MFGDLDLPAGSYDLRVLVRNGATGATSLRVVPLEVPAFAEAGPVLLPPFFPEPRDRWLLVRENAAPPKDVEYPFMDRQSPFIPAAHHGGTGNTGTATLTVNQIAPLVAALKSSSFVAATNDLDGSGSLSPGDTLLYTILITNTGSADALAVVLTDTPGAHTTLVAGSVTTTQGTVTNGNQVGATSVTVDLGTLAATSGQATVSFIVKLDNPFPPGVTTITNQATISGSNFSDVVSDNPATTPSGDPTVDVVTIAAVIPTISEDQDPAVLSRSEGTKPEQH
jgi:uncharacterized repeat protein (TIGR01451 family)